MTLEDPNALWPLLQEGAVFECSLPVSHPIRLDHIQMALEALPASLPKVVFCREDAFQRMRELPNYHPIEKLCAPIAADVPVGEAFCVALSDQIKAIRIITPASDSW